MRRTRTNTTHKLTINQDKLGIAQRDRHTFQQAEKTSRRPADNLLTTADAHQSNRQKNRMFLALGDHLPLLEGTNLPGQVSILGLLGSHQHSLLEALVFHLWAILLLHHQPTSEFPTESR